MSDEYIFTRFERNCERHPDRVALICLGERYTFSWLHESIERFATALHELGIRKDDKALLLLPNCVPWVIAYFGLQKIGAVPVPVSPIYTAREIGSMARDCEARLVICQDVNYAYIQPLRTQTTIDQVIVVNLADLLPGWKRAVGALFDKVPHGPVERREGVHSFRRLLSKYPPRPPNVEIDPVRHLACILYTGGTTGSPKGVPGTHRAMVSYVDDLNERVEGHLIPGEDVFVLVNPLFHIMAKGMFVTLGLNAGCSTVLMPEPQVDAILDAIGRFRVTLLLGVPALYRMILENVRRELYDLSSLRLCWSGGDVLPLEVARRWEEACRVRIRQVYGATEVGFVAMGRLDGETVPRSLGSVLPSRRHRVVDADTLQEVPAGDIGELLITSDHILKEYWNNPAETARSYVEIDGEVWYRMGDFVREDGSEIVYVDRRADLIKSKGFRVSASEIEAVLQDHPAVIESCVIGVPDEMVGERIKAFVILKKDARGVGSSDLTRWCAERVAPYKVPHYIEFRDMLPKSKVGKLLRRDLREEERLRAGRATDGVASGPSASE